MTKRDPTEIALPYGADGAVVPVQKFRDVQKLYAAMTDGKMEYAGQVDDIINDVIEVKMGVYLHKT